MRPIQTPSRPAAHRAQTRMSISTQWPAQAATSVAGTAELSRQVIPEWQRPQGEVLHRVGWLHRASGQ
jgi:hypothetical protein